jgi:hypothetical protein
MKTVLLILACLVGNVSFALPVTRYMKAAEFAVSVAFADFSNPDCVLLNDLDPADPSKSITFLLHTASAEASVILNPSDLLTYTVDKDTGAQSISGANVEMIVTDWTKITKLRVNNVECAPF